MQLYFMHDTLTPLNVRASFEADTVPPVGALLKLPYAGLDGAQARWRVVDTEWVWVVTGEPARYGGSAPGYWSVIVRCADA